MTIVRIKGENIDLCAVRQDEKAIEKYTEWMNDEEILLWIGRNDKNATFLSEKEWAENKKETLCYNITTKNGTLIGNCDIGLRGRNANFGICIGDKDERNKGYGTEAIKMLIKYSFEELNVHRCHLTLNGDNIRAHKCYLKAGFKDCGREHEVSFCRGKWCDVIHMEILEDEYFNNN